MGSDYLLFPFSLSQLGMTPLDCAQKHGHAAAAALLEADPRVAVAIAARVASEGRAATGVIS